MSAEQSAVAGFPTRHTYPVSVCVAHTSISVPLSSPAHCSLAGWYGAPFVCLTPLDRMNTSNSDAMNWGPLSETTYSGRPC